MSGARASVWRGGRSGGLGRASAPRLVRRKRPADPAVGELWVDPDDLLWQFGLFSWRRVGRVVGE